MLQNENIYVNYEKSYTEVRVQKDSLLVNFLHTLNDSIKVGVNQDYRINYLSAVS